MESEPRWYTDIGQLLQEVIGGNQNGRPFVPKLGQNFSKINANGLQAGSTHVADRAGSKRRFVNFQKNTEITTERLEKSS